MNLSILGTFSADTKIGNARFDKLDANPKITATAGDAVKADEIIISAKARGLTKADAAALPHTIDPPVLYGPKNLKPSIQHVADAKIFNVDKDGPPVLYAPKDDSIVGIPGKPEKIDGEVETIKPPRTRSEIWKSGWGTMAKLTKELDALVKKAADPGLSSTDRAMLNEQYNALLGRMTDAAESAIKEAGLTGQAAQIWRNSLGPRELHIENGDNLLTADAAQKLSEKLDSRVKVVYATANFFGVGV